MTVKWTQASLDAVVRRAVMTGVMIATEQVAQHGSDLIRNPPKTGRIYRRRGISHQASAPGEAPASDTPRLVQSDYTRYDQTQLSGVAGWSTDYARKLELGTERMAPRPFARPALAFIAPSLEAIIAGQLRAAL